MHFSNKCICFRPSIIIFHSIRGLNQRKIRIQLIPLSGYLIYLDTTLFCEMLVFLLFGKQSIFLSLSTFISCEHLYFQLSAESKWSLSPEGGSIKRTKCGVKYMPVSYIKMRRLTIFSYGEQVYCSISQLRFVILYCIKSFYADDVAWKSTYCVPDVIGVSRSGRVRKKPATLKDFESPYDVGLKRMAGSCPNFPGKRMNLTPRTVSWKLSSSHRILDNGHIMQ